MTSFSPSFAFYFVRYKIGTQSAYVMQPSTTFLKDKLYFCNGKDDYRFVGFMLKTEIGQAMLYLPFHIYVKWEEIAFFDDFAFNEVLLRTF